MRRSKYILFILMAVMVLFTGCVKKYKENNNNIEKVSIEYKVVKFFTSTLYSFDEIQKAFDDTVLNKIFKAYISIN